MTIDKHTLDKAREWVKSVDPRIAGDRALAAAEVIQSLPDVIVDGDKLRELADDMTTWRLPDEPSTVEDDLCKLHVIIDGFTDRALALLHPTPEPRVEIALGAWAMHPEHGKVLISSDKADSAGDVRVHVKDPRSAVGTAPVWVTAADLSPLPDTQGDSAGKSEYAPGGILPERTSAEKEKMHHTLEKLNRPGDMEPQEGEAWEVRAEDVGVVPSLCMEGCWAVVDDEGYYDILDDDCVTPLRRLVSAQEPRKLTSFREYKSAGVGTVVRDGSETTTKEGHGYWRDTDGIEYTDGDMAGVTSTVLWEPEA